MGFDLCHTGYKEVEEGRPLYMLLMMLTMGCECWRLGEAGEEKRRSWDAASNLRCRSSCLGTDQNKVEVSDALA